MELLFNLNGKEDIYSKLIFAHDLTPLEREECKQLVQDARKQEIEDTPGKWKYRVRGFPIPGSLRIVKISITTT